MAVQPGDRLLSYDIGGSHITVGLCLLEPISVLRMTVTPMTGDTSCRSFISLLFELGNLMSGDEQVAGASIAFPAPFAYAEGISYMQHKLKSLYGVNLKSALADRFGWTIDKIRFLNDADAALLGETGAGAAKGAAKAVGLMLGTGIGFSFVKDGSLTDTVPGILPDNEIWNLPFRNGIVEDLLSSRALEGDYLARTARRESVKTIAQQAAVNPDAQAVFHTFGVRLGQVLQEIVAPIGPDVVVVGGGISRSSHLFLPAARNQTNGLGIRLVPSILLDQAPLLGAAIYWRECAIQSWPSDSTLAKQP